jgi:hypothetical protein
MRQDLNSSQRLNSWKEIASYLGRGVRTVQRWEHELKLPVHRIGYGKRSPVYALTTELNFWVSTSEALRNTVHVPKPVLQMPSPTGSPVEDSRRLLADMHSLVHTVAEVSVRQRRQAELLEKRIAEMRARLAAGGGRR